MQKSTECGNFLYQENFEIAELTSIPFLLIIRKKNTILDPRALVGDAVNSKFLTLNF